MNVGVRFREDSFKVGDLINESIYEVAVMLKINLVSNEMPAGKNNGKQVIQQGACTIRG